MPVMYLTINKSLLAWGEGKNGKVAYIATDCTGEELLVFADNLELADE